MPTTPGWPMRSTRAGPGESAGSSSRPTGPASLSGRTPARRPGTCTVAADQEGRPGPARPRACLHAHAPVAVRHHRLPGLAVGTYDADCVADSDSSFAAGAGTVFATVGTGGIPLRDVNPADTEAGYFARSSGLNSTPTFGMLDMRATDTALTAAFVPTLGRAPTPSASTGAAAGQPGPPTAVFTRGHRRTLSHREWVRLHPTPTAPLPLRLGLRRRLPGPGPHPRTPTRGPGPTR